MTHLYSLAITSIAMGSCLGSDAELYDAWDQGGVEMYSELAGFAIISTTMANELSAKKCIFPLVYAYEVDETFATYFVVQVKSKTYDAEQAKLELGRIAYNYFSQESDINPIAAECIKVHTGYMPAPPIIAVSS